jgi:hypothetical protein
MPTPPDSAPVPDPELGGEPDPLVPELGGELAPLAPELGGELAPARDPVDDLGVVIPNVDRRDLARLDARNARLIAAF